uniref:SEFIR domain-containing protein n=1 Tax=Electrophorus electricus TaxID=8005 RepID=A0A4W4GLI9_ELEEL
MNFMGLRAALILFFSCQVSSLHVLHAPSLNCTTEVGIVAHSRVCPSDNCLYRGWLQEWQFTPSGPVDLEVHTDVRKDENGDLVPVIVARWKARDDGSISFLNGTELQVSKAASGQHLCVHYIFLQKFQSMRNPNGQQWSFSLDKVAVKPEETYFVSVTNLPKPNLYHTNYNITKIVVVPGCKDPAIQRTKFCLETGALWQPNITMDSTHLDGRTLFVTFSNTELSENYKVFVKCKDVKESKSLKKNNSSFVNVTFDLEAWPHTCCIFNVQIQPFFIMCGNDCHRKSRSFNICPEPPAPPPKLQIWWIVLAVVFLLLCSLAVCAICLQKKQNDVEKTPSESLLPEPVLPDERSVLIIYSRDHPQYTDIVLKLCAFLRAKCGTQVYLDLLDTTSVGVMGRLQWTELQKRRIERSSDKVLVLCSRGVQAKWGAMCGQPRVLLREDVCSPMGDMLTLALQLITPDMQRPASYGKYLVAYFEDISGEQDVPSLFDLAVKYKLMKHFEELYFRILDLEKYQRGMVHTVEGIGIDEYFSCPSGKALRNAIETFQAYQLENPDWFEKECLNNDDEGLVSEISPFLNQCTPPIHQCKPVLNHGPPICEYEVEIHEDKTRCVWTSEIPHLNLEFEEPSVLSIQPAHNQVYSLCPAVELPPGLHTAGVAHNGSDSHACSLAEPALQDHVPPSRNEVVVKGGSLADGCSVEDNELALHQLLDLQLSLASLEVPAPPPSLDDSNQESWDMHPSQPMEMDENEREAASGERPSRWSDQGYSSRDSIVREEPSSSSLAALAKLQEALYLNSPISSGFCTETMDS